MSDALRSIADSPGYGPRRRGDVSLIRPGEDPKQGGLDGYRPARHPIWKEASALLAITETAATAIKSLTASQEQPEEAGVRIAARDDAAVDSPESLKLSVVEGLAEDGQVVDKHGAYVFLEPHAASYLDDKLLDADIDGHQVRFAVSTQH
jgi:iron-sulfur cluster assembly protein